MPISLTHLSEALFAAMANQKRDVFADVAGLANVDREFFAGVERVAFREASLRPYGGLAFDGGSRVEVIVAVAPALATAFELKLGATQLTKTRIDGEWLADCRGSHEETRRRGNMMAILDRRFPGPTTDEPLTANVESCGQFALTRSGASLRSVHRQAVARFSPAVRRARYAPRVRGLRGRVRRQGCVQRARSRDAQLRFL